MDDVSFNLDHKLHQTPPPPPPTLLFRHHLNPISREKYMPIISGIGYHWQLQKTPLFQGILGEFPRDYVPKYPISRDKGRSWDI